MSPTFSVWASTSEPDYAGFGQIINYLNADTVGGDPGSTGKQQFCHHYARRRVGCHLSENYGSGKPIALSKHITNHVAWGS